MDTMKLVTLTDQGLGRTRMLCGHSPTYRQGYDAKVAWVRQRLQEGMRYTVAEAGRGIAGMIEYLPAEFAWRPVEADGYMFIHCFWVVGSNRKHGYGRQMLAACLADSTGMKGVAVLSSRTHWLPTRRIFLKNGFDAVDVEPPFELLAIRFDPKAPLPRIRRNIPSLPAGLTLHYSDQCPYMQNMPTHVERAGRELGLTVNIIHLDSAAQAQASPCPYGLMGIFLDGRLLEYRPTNSEKLVSLITQQREATR